MGKVTEADRAFLRSFEDERLEKTCWTHRAHVRMAWLVLEDEGNFQSGLDRIRRSIQRYNASVGSVGYHETMTVAFARLVHHRKQQGHGDETFEEFAGLHGDLLSRPSILHRYYGPEDVTAAAGKHTFVAPSRRPLPLIGEIRPVTSTDAAAIARIYAPYVRETAVSFEVDPPSEAEIGQRLEKVTASYPWFVFETKEGIAGYAYASRHRERPAYRWAVEVSVYVDAARHHGGVGRALYGRLLAELRVRGFHVALGGISLPNEASVRLHEVFGFERIGVYRAIGFKNGQWHDVGWWQKLLGDGSAPRT